VLAALELNPGVAFAMLDRILGGSGESNTPQRALTEIEQNVVDSVIKLLIEHLTEAWKSADIKFQIHARETRPQMLPVVSWNEIVILMTFDLKVGEARGLLNICVPASVVEASGGNFSQSLQQARRDRTPQEAQWLTDSLGQAPLTITADVATSLRTRELLNLAPGQILSLGMPVDTGVNVRVGDIVKFTGRLAMQAGRAAVQVQQICTAPAAGPGGK